MSEALVVNDASIPEDTLRVEEDGEGFVRFTARQTGSAGGESDQKAIVDLGREDAIRVADRIYEITRAPAQPQKELVP